MFFLVASEEEAPRDTRAGDPGAEMAFLAQKILGQMMLLTLQMKTPEEGTMVLGGEVEVLQEVRGMFFHTEVQGWGKKGIPWADDIIPMNTMSLLTPVPASLTAQELGRVCFPLQMNSHALKEGGNQNPGMETENQVKHLVRFVDFYNVITF